MPYPGIMYGRALQPQFCQSQSDGDLGNAYGFKDAFVDRQYKKLFPRSRPGIGSCLLQKILARANLTSNINTGSSENGKEDHNFLESYKSMI